MSPSNHTLRPVYLCTRTINELGESARDFFKVAQDLTGHNFSTIMHWSLLIDTSLFELSGNAKSNVHTFVMKSLTPEIRNGFQSKQIRGYTSMSDEEILAAGLAIARQFPEYNILGDNCQIVVERLLARVVERKSRRAVEKPFPIKNHVIKVLETWPGTTGIVSQQIIDVLGGSIGKFLHSGSSI